MAENKVVIKINYDKDKNLKPINVEPKMVTVWHTRRILAAAAVLIVLVAVPVFWLSGNDNSDAPAPASAASEEIPLTINNPVPVNVSDTVNVGKAANVISDPQNLPTSKSASASNSVKRPPAIIYDKKVIRASLNTGPKDKEPYQQVRLPIKLAHNQSIELFYFNELRNINERHLYHHWIKDGLTVDKKSLNISDNKVKVLSGKTLSYKDRGEWQIQLVDKKGKVFSEVSFSIIPQ